MTTLNDMILAHKTQGAPDNDGGLLTLTAPTGVHGANINDNNSSLLPIGFNFNFDDVDYTQFRVNTNGYVQLVGNLNSANNADLYASNGHIILAPWWDDLKTAEGVGYTRYELRGAAPDRLLVIEWLCYANAAHVLAAHILLQFQCVFRENGYVEFRYAAASTVGAPAGPYSASGGVKKDTTSGIGNNIRDFYTGSGISHPNGGSAWVLPAPPGPEIALDVSANDWPVDPGNPIAGAAYNWSFVAGGVRCKGWGLLDWGEDPWGTGTLYAPEIVVQSPPCGSTHVSSCMPILLKIGSRGCSALDLDCVRITLNGDLIYDGSGLVFGVDEEDGWQAPCDTNSTVTSEVIAGYNEVWVFTIDCGCFTCGSVVEYEALFCTEEGAGIDISCSYAVAPCNYISSVEIIDKKHILVRFSNPMLRDVFENPLLYDPNSYSLTLTTLGIIEGRAVSVKDVFVDASLLPSHVILEHEEITDGAAYQVSGSSDILDKYHQNLQERGHGVVIGRRTKTERILSNLPGTYNKKSRSPNSNQLSLYHIAAVLGIEDDRIGGDY